MASVHDYEKKKSIENPELFAGNIPFCGRTLKYLLNFLSKYDENQLSEMIYNAIFNIYLNSFVGEKEKKIEFKEKLFETFVSVNEDSIKFEIAEEDEERILKIKIFLKEIEERAKGNKNNTINFNLNYFLNVTCKYLQIKDLYNEEKNNIINLIENTMKILKNSRLKHEELNDYFQLNVLLNILKSIKNLKLETATTNILNEKDIYLIERKNNIDITILLKLIFLKELIQEKNNFPPKLNYFFYSNNEIYSFLKLIIELYINPQLNNFTKLIDF